MSSTHIAAYIAAAGFAAMTVFQLVLASGAPVGHLACGGRYQRLPRNLRLASVASAGVFVAAAIFVLERAGILSVIGVPGLVRVVVWVLVVMFALSTIGNLASKSPHEKRLMTPVALLLTICCLVVALGE